MTAHRILIAAAIVAALVFAAWGFFSHRAGESGVILGALSLIVALALTVYFTWLRRKR